MLAGSYSEISVIFSWTVSPNYPATKQAVVLLNITLWWLSPKSPWNKGGNAGCCYLLRDSLYCCTLQILPPLPRQLPLCHEDWDNHVGLSITFPVLVMIYNKAFLTPLCALFIHYSMYFNHCSESRGTAAELYNTTAEVFHQDQQTISEGSKERLSRKSGQSSVALIHCKDVNIFIRQFLYICELKQILTFVSIMPRKMKANSKCLVTIQIKVSLLSLAEITCPLQHFWTSPYLSSTSNTHNLENPSENQNQLSGERKGSFRISIPKEWWLLQKY